MSKERYCTVHSTVVERMIYMLPRFLFKNRGPESNLVNPYFKRIFYVALRLDEMIDSMILGSSFTGRLKQSELFL